MNVTRRGAFIAGAGALAGLLSAARGLRAAPAQETSPARLLTQAYNACGQQLFKQLAAAPGNIVFSPYSIGTAMAMALAGARGDTERQMLSVLQQRLTREQIDAANAEVLAALNGYDHSAATPTCPPGLRLGEKECEAPLPASGSCSFPARRDGERCTAPPIYPPSAQLSVADALMLTGRDGFIAQAYIALLKQKYAAEVFENASLLDINAWVARQTHGKIDKILEELDPDSSAVLLNAVYFKAKWASFFTRSLTADAPFHLTNAQQVAVPTMRRSGAYAMVARDGYRAVRLPYEVEPLGMVIVLPNEIEGAGAVGARLGQQELSELFAALRTSVRQLDLALPRFKLEFKAELVRLFQQAGMTLPFDGGRADFSGMTGSPDRRLAIGGIVHRAMIDVMEDGTEAAAATAITMVRSSAPAKAEEFRVDRPFLFYLVDNATGAILFQGRVSDPR